MISFFNCDSETKQVPNDHAQNAIPCIEAGLRSFSSPEPRILWLRMTRGSGKLCRSLAKIWLFGPHGALRANRELENGLVI